MENFLRTSNDSDSKKIISSFNWLNDNFENFCGIPWI